MSLQDLTKRISLVKKSSYTVRKEKICLSDVDRKNLVNSICNECNRDTVVPIKKEIVGCFEFECPMKSNKIAKIKNEIFSLFEKIKGEANINVWIVCKNLHSILKYMEDMTYKSPLFSCNCYNCISNSNANQKQTIHKRKQIVHKTKSPDIFQYHQKIEQTNCKSFGKNNFENVNDINTEVDANQILKTEDLGPVEYNIWDSIKSEDVEIKDEIMFEDENKVNIQVENGSYSEEEESMEMCTVMCICDDCGYKTEYRDELQHHKEILHKKKDKKIYRCCHCDFKTNYKSNLYRHKIRHPKNICKYCSKVCRTKDNLDRHIQRHHNDEPDPELNQQLACNFCEMMFVNKITFKSHLLRQHGEVADELIDELYYCQWCKFRTVYKSHLANHIMRVHEKECGDPLLCPNCNFTTYSSWRIKRHLFRCHQIKPYACSVCRLEYGTKKRLDAHILKHHRRHMEVMWSITSKVLSCPYCSFRCVYCNDLKYHIMKHK